MLASLVPPLSPPGRTQIDRLRPKWHLQRPSWRRDARRGSQNAACLQQVRCKRDSNCRRVTTRGDHSRHQPPCQSVCVTVRRSCRGNREEQDTIYTHSRLRTVGLRTERVLSTRQSSSQQTRKLRDFPASVSASRLALNGPRSLATHAVTRTPSQTKAHTIDTKPDGGRYSLAAPSRASVRLRTLSPSARSVSAACVSLSLLTYAPRGCHIANGRG